MKRLTILALLIPELAFSANTFYRAHDADSVVLGPICIPEFAGTELFDVDFDTTSLTITIYASGDSADTSFTYTGGNIDNYDGTPPAWGDPTTSAVEVEDDDECIRLHIRDEVLAVSGASEWTVKFTDSTADQIMDWEVQVLALGTNSDIETATSNALTAFGAATDSNVDDNEAKIDTLQATADSNEASLSGIETDIADLPVATWNVACEDQGSGFTCQEVMSLLLSEAIGECTYTSGTRTWVCDDPSGTETRFTIVYGTELDGDRTSSTPEPMTP